MNTRFKRVKDVNKMYLSYLTNCKLATNCLRDRGDRQLEKNLPP